MKHMEFEINGKMYHRVSKPMARKAFDKGEWVMVCPCKFRPGHPWYPTGFSFRKKLDREFDKIVRDYEYYHCNAEAGWYLSFYLEVKEIPGE